MFLSSLCTPFVTLAAYTATISTVPTVSSVPSLTVRTPTSNLNVDGSKDPNVTATIVNTGGETLKRNGPYGVLRNFPENSFIDASGSCQSFSGATVNYCPMDAAGVDGPSASALPAPGNSIDVIHDPPGAYGSTESGAGGYPTEPSNLFTHVDVDGTPKNLDAAVGDLAEAKVSGDLAITQRPHGEQASFEGCSDEQQELLNAAARTAQILAAESFAYIRDLSFETPRYKTWFGRYHAGRKARVLSVFQNITRNTHFESLTYDCRCDLPGTNAEVGADLPDEMLICTDFWKRDPKLQAATLLHEASHFHISGNTKDHGYGQLDCKILTFTMPWKAVNNADNYMYFVTNPYNEE